MALFAPRYDARVDQNRGMVAQQRATDRKALRQRGSRQFLALGGEASHDAQADRIRERAQNLYEVV